MTRILALVLLLSAFPGVDALQAEVFLHDNPFHVAISPARLDVAGNWTIRVTNAGSVPHDFTLCSPNADNSCSTPLAFTPLLRPGGNATFIVSLATGTYPFVCRVAGHADGGMKGTLVVGMAAGSEAASTPDVWFPAALVVLGALAWRRRQ